MSLSEEERHGFSRTQIIDILRLASEIKSTDLLGRIQSLTEASNQCVVISENHINVVVAINMSISNLSQLESIVYKQ